MPNIDEIRIVGQEITYDIRPKEDASHQNVSAEEKAQWNAKSDFSGNYADLQGKPDLSQFVTKAVDDLTNYYLKSETYTKQEVQQLLSSFNSGVFKIIDTLPTASAATTGLKIYLVPSQNQEAQNVKDEFITIEENGSYRWEQIGSTAMSLDGYVTETALNQALSSYVTSSAFTSALAQKQDVIPDLATIRSGAAAGATAVQPAALNNKQDKFVSGENIKTVNGESLLGSGNIVAGDPNAIKYTEQSLTAAQQGQARTNIGAASQADLENVQKEEYVTVATLADRPAASASTLGKIYMVGPNANNQYDKYYTSFDGTAYSWVSAGTTEIDLTTYAKQTALDQLGQEVNALIPETVEDGFFIVDENLNVGAVIDEDGIHTKNIVEFETVE